jgi:transcription antitermination factor NusG
VSDHQEEQQWFSIGCTSLQKELRVRDDARRYGLQAFVPLKYVVKTVRGQKQRALVPALSKLLFVKGTLEEVKDYIQHAHYVVFIRKSTFSNKEKYLTVPTKAMEDFIAVTENYEEHVTYFRPEEISLQEGDQIRIKGGLYDGREGIIMRIKGKRNKHLVVQIPGMLLAAVELSPEMIELPQSPTRSLSLSKGEVLREKPSKNIDKDKKLLMETAQRLLFEIPDKYQHENEYYLLLSELKRARERLKTFKGYTPATEAELALPMYLAAVQLQEGIPEAESRLQTAISKLKDTSKLKATCLSYLEKLRKN